MGLRTHGANEQLRTAVALVAAPVVSLIGFSVHPKVYDTGVALLANIDAHSFRWNLSHIVLFFDGMLWLLAIRTLTRLLAPHRPRAASAGAFFGTVGSLAIAGITTGELVLAKVAAGTAGTPSSALAHQFDHGGTGLFVGPLCGLLLIGLILLMVGLRRAGVVSLGPVIAVIAGSVLFNFSGDVENIPVILAGESMRLAGLLWVVGQLHGASRMSSGSLSAVRQRVAVSAQSQSGSVCLRSAASVLMVAGLVLAGCSERDTKTTSETGATAYCQLAEKLDQQAGPPTQAQIAELQKVAPDAIKADVKALLVDHKEDAEPRLVAWEKANC